ncbi:uncharacterized protein LOC114354363 [Ostrinia furnacalis]|uniref:uncharacterized protein LOC114354363 n=1 Tax=Ostrinia furnacalis TaxID=93504 RepID=UPI00103E88D2|nr:uncharacterized protein LOC114354363 [Ostrinia furnacalis]
MEAGPSSGADNNQHDDDDPLLEQMNIIRGYIKEARKELRFEEVGIKLVMIQMERERMAREPVLEAGPSSGADNNQHDDDDPLLEQMNIIRGYIKEARKELRFEEVAILEANLKELKKEYQFQKLSSKS